MPRPLSCWRRCYLPQHLLPPLRRSNSSTDWLSPCSPDSRHLAQRLGRDSRPRLRSRRCERSHPHSGAATEGDRDRNPKLPVVMIASPYSGGQLPFPQHDITQPLYVPPPGGPVAEPLPPLPPIGHAPPNLGNTPPFPNIGTSGYQTYFLPRGFIFVYAQSLGTGLSTGCPTIGGIRGKSRDEGGDRLVQRARCRIRPERRWGHGVLDDRRNRR